MSLVVRRAGLRAAGWLILPFLLIACSQGGTPVGTAALAPTGTVAQPAPPTTVATGGPRPSVATPTMPPSPPPATAPAATPTTPQRPAATPGRGTATPGSPLGPIPAGWRVYQGPLPFAIAYPPDWTVDESQLQSSNTVYIFAPGADQSVFLVIATTGMPEETINLDVLRDRWFQARTRACTAFAPVETGRETLNGINFATIGATCDLPTGLAYSYTGLGVRGTVPWIFEFNAPYELYEAELAASFRPMIASLNIYGGFFNR